MHQEITERCMMLYCSACSRWQPTEQDKLKTFRRSSMTIKESQTLNEKQGQEIEVSCLRCDGETCHKVLFSVEQTREEVDEFNFVPGDSIFTWYDYQIIQCQGCKTISFRQTSSSNEDYFAEFGGECYVYETIYPSRIKDKKGLEKLHLLPLQIQDIYTETLRALNNGYLILAGIGLRALVESVCNEKSAEGRLIGKIDNLKENHILTPANAEILHKIRTLGNDAAHKVKKHKKDELELAMNVVEHLLTDVYILPQQAKILPTPADKKL